MNLPREFFFHYSGFHSWTQNSSRAAKVLPSLDELSPLSPLPPSFIPPNPSPPTRTSPRKRAADVALGPFSSDPSNILSKKMKVPVVEGVENQKLAKTTRKRKIAEVEEGAAESEPTTRQSRSKSAKLQQTNTAADNKKAATTKPKATANKAKSTATTKPKAPTKATAVAKSAKVKTRRG